MAEPTPGPPSGLGERRRVTVLYTDLARSTLLSRALEAEHYRGLLFALRAIWHAAADQHHGRVVMAQGDGALLAFGLPQAGEDDGRCAVEAALDIHHQVAQLVPDGIGAGLLPLQMHSGVHVGTLLVADGDIERGLFDLTGEATNIAAHLSKQAPAGQVLATLAALGPHANFFELAAASVADDGPADLATLQVWRVLGRSPAKRRFDGASKPGLTPFIGRSDILGELLQFLDPDRHSGARCMVVQAGPGMGKTRLIDQLARQDRLAGSQVLRGDCEHYGGAEVLQPFLQAVRAGLQSGAVVDLPADRLARLNLACGLLPARASLPAPGGPARPGLRPGASAQTADDVLAYLLAHAAIRPSVLMVDDWQWADDASRQLLLALLQQPGSLRVLVASRPRDDGGEWVLGTLHLSLRPFEPAQTQAAVRRRLPWADPLLAARIHDYGGGVPLFIEELCHSVSADPAWHTLQGRRADLGWLATLVVSRLGRLPADEAAVVRAASVVGNLVPLRLLAAACGQVPSAGLLQALADADFLRSEPGGQALRFKHGITRDAVYDAIGLHERTALHRRIEAALLAGPELAEREDTQEALAYHCRGAGHWELAARFAELAGDKAMAAFALDLARAQYLAAMDALDRLPLMGQAERLRWCGVANKLGMTCIFDTLAMPDALPLFERCLDRAQETGEAVVIARAHYWLGYLCYGHGHPRRAARHCREALRIAQAEGERQLAAQVQATLGQVLAAACHYDEALQLMAGALQAKREGVRAGSSVAVGSAFTLACQGSAWADRGQFDAAHQAFAQARSLLGGSPHPVGNSVRNWAVMVLLWQGRWDEALQVADETARIAEQSRALLPLAIARAAGGQALWMGSAAPQGLEQTAEAVLWMEQRRVQFYTSIYYGWLVEGCAALDQPARVRSYAARLLMRARAGEVLGLASGYRTLALAAMAGGRSARAERYWQAAQACALRRGSQREAALNLQCQAQLLRLQGRGAPARLAAQQARQAFEGLGMAWHASALRDLV